MKSVNLKTCLNAIFARSLSVTGCTLTGSVDWSAINSLNIYNLSGWVDKASKTGRFLVGVPVS